MVKFDIREGKEPSQTPKFPSPLGLSPSSLAGERRAFGEILLNAKFPSPLGLSPSSLAESVVLWVEIISNAKFSSPFGLSHSWKLKGLCGLIVGSLREGAVAKRLREKACMTE